MRASARVGVAGLVVALAAWGAVVAEAQCVTCAPEMICLGVSRGACFCAGDGLACVVALPCPGRIGPRFEWPSHASEEGVAAYVVLYDEAAGKSGFPLNLEPRAVTAAGERPSCERSRHALERVAGRPVAGEETARGLFIATSCGVPAALKTAAGGGYGLAFEREGSDLRVVVRSLAFGRAERVVARSLVTPDDVLIARLDIDGRPYVLTLQARLRDPGESLSALQEAFFRELRVLPRRAELETHPALLED